jgi:hypothetical protein
MLSKKSGKLPIFSPHNKSMVKFERNDLMDCIINTRKSIRGKFFFCLTSYFWYKLQKADVETDNEKIPFSKNFARNMKIENSTTDSKKCFLWGSVFKLLDGIFGNFPDPLPPRHDNVFIKFIRNSQFLNTPIIAKINLTFAKQTFKGNNIS